MSMISTFELLESTIKCLKLLMQLYYCKEVDYKDFITHSNSKIKMLKNSQNIILDEINNTIKEIERIIEAPNIMK